MRVLLHGFKCTLLVALAVTLSACGYLIAPKVKVGVVNLEKGSYQIDPSHTSVLFKIDHMGMSTFVGRFNESEASLEFDPAHMENAKLTALIKIPSIDLNNKDLEETLKGSSWLKQRNSRKRFLKQSLW